MSWLTATPTGDKVRFLPNQPESDSVLRMCWTAAAIIVLPMRVSAQWYQDTTKDAMTDQVTWYMATHAKDTRASVWLRLSCNTTNGLTAYMNVDRYLSDHDALVQYRFDSDPASVPQRWDLSTSRDGVFAPDQEVLAFAARARTATKLVIRVDEATYTFGLDKTQYKKDPDVSVLDTLTFTAALERLPCRNLSATDVGDAEGSASIVPTSDQVYLEAVVEERPELLTSPAVQYPDLLRQAGVSGRVLVQAVIDTTGRAIASTIRILRTPHPGFEDAARRFILQSLYRPGRVGGRAVKVLVSVPVDFTLKK